MSFLNGHKTTLTALATFLIAIGYTINAYFNGEPLKIEVLLTAGVSLALIFLRKGIKNEVENNKTNF